MSLENRTTWIIAGLAAVAIVVIALLLLFHRGVFDTGKDAETVFSWDETEQSPRLRSPSVANGAGAETERGSNATDQASSGDEGDENGRASGSGEASVEDLDAIAREYDDNGQVGEPPEGWKPDYSHWDTMAWGKPSLEEVGILERHIGTALVYRPSEETRQRRQEIENERNAAIEKGLITGAPREGYVKREFDDGDDAAYVARSFVGRFDAMLAEDILLNKGGMREEPAVGYTGGGFLGYRNPTGNFEIYYYRETDGSLTRYVILKNSKVERHYAGPPPDLEALGFTPRDIEIQKNRWQRRDYYFLKDEY